ncbi:hypothetical protein SUDANB1_05609 [Streptomyces sp. enrichment culture]|uniref:hypothetical protein n=1 Tax=Streptomyces sp. enrichment culture TaxID=1795815 RepID=UPI003F57DC3D
MRITRLTPEQARAIGEVFARVTDWFRTLYDQLRAFAARLAETLRPLVRLAEQIRQHPAARRRDRPAWASPYGPAPRRP